MRGGVAPEGRILLERPDGVRGEEHGDARHSHGQVVNVAVEGAVWAHYPLLQHLQDFPVEIPGEAYHAWRHSRQICASSCYRSSGNLSTCPAC